MVKREANQEGHKYLGILEREDVCQYEFKKNGEKRAFQTSKSCPEVKFEQWQCH